ncbi:MAG TPA: DUF389 domain-containing protein [Pyrinomonadaceae bacterium]
MEKWLRFLKLVTSIRQGTDVNGTIQEITENAELRGANVWMLFCSTILASIGLDLNSTAVIIGAMLISPLMSPILGVGLGIAIFDRQLLRNGFQSLFVATAISLGTSSAYFFISPLGELTQELAARTTPTLLDIGVAFFGGIAGIVAGSRLKKTSAIPGVAIATALMPPVCTAGFGIAKADSSIFLGAFYLFFINAFFISLATYLICIFLRFPRRAELDTETSIWVRRAIIAGAIVVSIPSAIIFYGVLQKARLERGIRSFVETSFEGSDRQPVRWEVDRTQTPALLKVYVVGRPVGAEELAALRTQMRDYGISELDLSCVQLNLARSELQKLSATVENDVAERLRIISAVDEQQENAITTLKADIDQLRLRTDPDVLLIADIRRRFPRLLSVESRTLTEESGIEVQVIAAMVAAGMSQSDVVTTKSDIEKYLKERRPEETPTVQLTQAASNENAVPQ